MSPTSYQTAPPRGVRIKLPDPPIFEHTRLPSRAMRWRRRQREPGDSVATTHPSALPVLAPRVERALITLATHAQQLDSRIAGLERRLDDVVSEVRETDVLVPTQEDVLEVRMHSANVAAELARVSIELRRHIARAADAPGSRTAPAAETGASTRWPSRSSTCPTPSTPGRATCGPPADAGRTG